MYRQNCDTLSQQLTSGVICFSDYLFKCKLTAMRSLQYCCLLIPVKNRELLQMLLKFMVKLMDNHVISLSDELPTKEMVRQWFNDNNIKVIPLKLFYYQTFFETWRNEHS